MLSAPSPTGSAPSSTATAIDRRVKTCSKNRGDITGLRVHGQRVVVELKDVSRMAMTERVNEADEKRGNDDALPGVVIHKRRAKGSPADWYVSMTGAGFLALLGGARREGS